MGGMKGKCGKKGMMGGMDCGMGGMMGGKGNCGMTGGMGGMDCGMGG